MAISSVSAIAAAIKTELIAEDPDGFGSLSTANQNFLRDKLFTAIARVIREELTTNAEVAVTINPGALASGVTAGAASVPVTGTATGTPGAIS